MADGWIKLHRKLSDNELWLSDTFTRGQAWIDLLILANHETGCIRKRGILVYIDRGQVGYSEDTLSIRWKWSRGKIRRFLKELESNNQIIHSISEKTVQKNSSVSSLITIVNYDKYQLNDTEDSTEDGRKTDGRRYRNKNEKNEKKRKILIVPSFDEVQAYCLSRNNGINPQAFIDYYAARGWMLGKSKMKDWKAAVRTWESRNNVSEKKEAWEI
jgi:hypothetical protein